MHTNAIPCPKSLRLAALNAQIEQFQLPINQLQQHADCIARRPFDESMVTLAIIKDLEEEEYQATRYWQSRHQISAKITTHPDLVFMQPGPLRRINIRV
jgi:hypothetical protein